jgi:tetratricopeptide (TPR) repeat protein
VLAINNRQGFWIQHAEAFMSLQARNGAGSELASSKEGAQKSDENGVGVKNTPLFFVTPVWGFNHLNLFTEVGLPSLLSSGNLPSTFSSRKCCFLIYTRIEDEEILDRADIFRRLKSLMPVEIHHIAEPLGDNPHRVMSDCHAAALHRADTEDAAAVFIPPDCVWADGSMASLARLADAGKAMVHISGVRLDRDAVVPLLRTYLDADRGVTGIGARPLAALGLSHLHKIAKTHFWEEFDGGLMPANLSWTVSGEGLALRCFHLHPLMVKSQKKFSRFESTIDDDLALFACPDESGDYVVTDSDEILAFELSDPERIIAGNFKKGDVEGTAAWMEVGTNDRHHLLAMHAIRVHTGPITEATWRPVEEKGRALIAELLKINRSSSLSLALRHRTVLHFRYYAMTLRPELYRSHLKRLERAALRALLYAVSLGDLARALFFDHNGPRPDPVAASLYRRSGDIKRRLGLLESAIADYGTAIACGPSNPALYFVRGTALLKKRDNARAAEDFRTGLTLDPENSTLRRLLMIAEGVEPQESSAVKFYRTLGSIKRRLRLFDGAISDYGTAIGLSPKNPDLYLLRGRVLLKKGETARATEDFERGLVLDPNNGILLGLLHQATAGVGLRYADNGASAPANSADRSGPV